MDAVLTGVSGWTWIVSRAHVITGLVPVIPIV